MSRAPVLTYVKSRGLYAGVQLVGQVFVERFDENGKMYNWPGVKAGDIVSSDCPSRPGPPPCPDLWRLLSSQLAGKVRVPYEAKNLQAALQDAESGRAQRMKGEGLDVVVYPEIPDELVLEEGEVLRLPPTPTMELMQERQRGGRSSDDRSDDDEKEEEGGPSAGLYTRRASEGLPPPPQRNSGVAGPGGRRVPPPMPQRDGQVAAHSPLASSSGWEKPTGGWVPPPPPRRNPLHTVTPSSSLHAVPPPLPPVSSPSDAPSPSLAPPAIAGEPPLTPPPTSTLSSGFEADIPISDSLRRVSLSSEIPAPPAHLASSVATTSAPPAVILAQDADEEVEHPYPSPPSSELEDVPVPSYDKVMAEEAQTDKPAPVVSDKKEQLVV